MPLLAETKKLCQKYHFYPLRRKGQNFLIDENVLEKIIAAAGLKKDDLVLEIGPGLGVLTRELASRVKKVFSVEIDKKLVEILKEELKDFKNIEIIQEDILKISGKGIPLSPPLIRGRESPLPPFDKGVKSPLAPLNKGGYKIVANLPYNITSTVLRKFLANKPRPKLIVVMVQKEVAERICAKPGKMSLLSLSVQFYGEPEIVEYVSKKSFWPVPEVDSAILRITPKNAREMRRFILRPVLRSSCATATEDGSTTENGLTPKISEKDFFRIARIGFSSRRKQLQNNLTNGLKLEKEKVKAILEETGINSLARAEDLRVADWVRLAEKLAIGH